MSTETTVGDPATSQHIRSIVEQFWRALDARDVDTARQMVTSDIVIMDAFAPHVWSGPDAFATWQSDLWAYCESLGITVGQTTLREPSRCVFTGDAGYIVVPAMMASASDHDLIAQSGVVTAVLRREDQEWRIAAICWAGQ
ncbi:MAG: nuclear transport factor 2 family protein [Sphingomonas sp.]|nr:nuclear transport factor 2 family protein [Sphingomonas sp.]